MHSRSVHLKALWVAAGLKERCINAVRLPLRRPGLNQSISRALRQLLAAPQCTSQRCNKAGAWRSERSESCRSLSPAGRTRWSGGWRWRPSRPSPTSRRRAGTWGATTWRGSKVSAHFLPNWWIVVFTSCRIDVSMDWWIGDDLIWRDVWLDYRFIDWFKMCRLIGDELI
jgi:hypothetical protein